MMKIFRKKMREKHLLKFKSLMIKLFIFLLFFNIIIFQKKNGKLTVL